MWYQDWAHAAPFDAAGMAAVSSRGAMPMVTWQPWDSGMGVRQPDYSLASIIGSTYDPYIAQWAQGAKAYGKPFYLRFAHEMNGIWYPWGDGVNGNTTGQYIAAWRHVQAIFRREGAMNARWVWSPNVASGAAKSSFATFYPGDASIDWVGMDGYNWGTSQGWSTWQTLATVFGPTYGSLAKMTAKPMMIAETASAEEGGSKARWIAQGLANTIPASYPRIKAVIWFDEDKETNWRVDSSPTALAAYRLVAKSAAYQGKLT